MPKVSIIILISLFSLLNSAAVRRKRRDTAEKVKSTTVPKWTNQPSNYSDKIIDVLLRDPSLLNPENTEYISANTSLKSGLVEVFPAGASKALFLCFPQNTEDYRKAYVLSHVICRQLGFMTFASMNSKISPSTNEQLFNGLKPNSYSCTGQEQNVSHCEWNNISIGSCKAITELTCGDCQHALKDSSGFIEAPGYPLVNIYDVTCEWDLTVDEDHSLSLSFHNFRSLFSQSPKLFCNLHQPYMDIMYGRWNRMSYRRFCNLEDMQNMTIPEGKVKIRIYTGLYTPYGVNGEGKSVAITFEVKPAEASGTWSWKIAFVVLILLIVLIILALFHNCKKYGLCDVHRNSSTLPMVNAPPTLADIDRAYEFQRCAIQEPLKEKMGLRLRSNGSGEKNKNLFFPSFCQDETFIVSSVEKKSVIAKEKIQNNIYDETPRNTIPEIVLSAASEDELNAIERVRVNLLDRYSKNSCDLSDISTNSSSSPLFFPARQSFQIYSSVSSDNEKEEKKLLPPPSYDSAL